MMSATARGGLPSARASASATFDAMSPWVGSFGASTATATPEDFIKPLECALSMAAEIIGTMRSFMR
jgi:hypothetical protein